MVIRRIVPDREPTHCIGFIAPGADWKSDAVSFLKKNSFCVVVEVGGSHLIAWNGPDGILQTSTLVQSENGKGITVNYSKNVRQELIKPI